MSDPQQLEIRSYRVVFELDRRLHRIDRWRLPLPYGLPLRSVGYAVAALLGVLLASRLPLVGTLLTQLPAAVRLALLPCATAYALTSVQVDGRPAHDALAALLTWQLQPRVVTCWGRGVAPGRVVRFGDIAVAPDAGGTSLPRGTVTGPAVARIHYPTALRARARALVLRQAADAPLRDGFEIEVDRRRRLVIR